MSLTSSATAEDHRLGRPWTMPIMGHILESTCSQYLHISTRAQTCNTQLLKVGLSRPVALGTGQVDFMTLGLVIFAQDNLHMLLVSQISITLCKSLLFFARNELK
eukprot:TRINITY_DN10699_c1_g1_i1.p1 TRINITY_DN10699_c1_g1~~TRINITY_DN10699_c1_g1_i1.p1  ORF type:complete len:105 (+),score=2.24 TRINITY_DN10699_c1_g1_i1:524-838(+)